MNKNIIYFTKEDGKNILLGTASTSLQIIDIISPAAMKLFKKRLGHKPTNIYIWIDGDELKLLA